MRLCTCAAEGCGAQYGSSEISKSELLTVAAINAPSSDPTAPAATVSRAKVIVGQRVGKTRSSAADFLDNTGPPYLYHEHIRYLARSLWSDGSRW